ncbi:hypothetical protein DUI87_19846 [Hirundo rustica rustica]|uniref:Uncharacterized protein n=1 Tax=Hirundo rustica rustica TaxID=333673 RepID=A0A3M0JNR1_HIRRU|nr:hypothetical protein DUI87_19846 [Hirundo rustica rustica]
MAAEKAGKVKDPEVRLAGCLRAILTTTRPEREFPRRFEGDLCHAQRLWPAPGSQRAFPSHWALPDEAGKGEKILGKPQSLRLLFFPAKYPGASAVIPEDEERLGMRRRDLEPPFSQNDTSAERCCKSLAQLLGATGPLMSIDCACGGPGHVGIPGRRRFVPGKCRTRTDTEFLGTLAEREKQQMVLGEFLSPPGPKLFLASTPSGMSAFPMGYAGLASVGVC